VRLLGIGLAAVIIVSGCTLAPSSRRVIEDDFIEEITPEQRSEVWQDISDIKSRLEDDFDNADLHRRLAVLYRLAATPRARLLSLESIDRAIMLEPNDPRNYVEKGLTLRARQYLGEAEAAFNRAAEIDPYYPEAWYQLGEIEKYHYFKTMCFPDHLKKSIGHYKKAYKFDKRNEDTLFNLAFLHMFRSMFRTSRKFAYKTLEVAPENPRNQLLLGTIFVHFKRFDEAQLAFDKAFAMMADEERTPYEDIHLLLPSDVRELYETSSPDKKTEWNRKFWIEQDPTPSSEINERRLEHYRRVFLASETLTNKRLALEGEDTDRGKAMVKFGMPDKKYYDLSGSLTGGWIIWEYRLGNQPFRLYFHDEFLSGNYHFPIADYYGRISVDIMERLPQKYEYPVRFKTLPLRADAAIFRGLHERTRLDFALGFPQSEVEKKGSQWNAVLTIFDSDWNRIFLETRALELDTLPRITKMNSTFLAYPFWIEIIPRYMPSTCVLELVNDEFKLKGTWRHSIEIRDLFGKSLKLSSIALKVPEAGGGCSDLQDPLPIYRPEEGLCLSYEIYNLSRGEDNLARYRVTYAILKPAETRAESSLKSTLSYMWSSIWGTTDDNEPYISSSLDQSTNMDWASDKLHIDLTALGAGNYFLLLEVQDLLTGEAVQEGKLFTISD
jgi:GWxTD domain-containing protein